MNDVPPERAEARTTNSEPPEGGTPIPETEAVLEEPLLTCTGLLIEFKSRQRVERWLRLCAGNREMVANYDRLRGTNLSGRGAPIDRLIDEATGKLEAEALVFFDWCRELFDRLGWDEVDG